MGQIHIWPQNICDERCARSRSGTRNYTPQYLRGVITCPCPWYMHLAQHSSLQITYVSGNDKHDDVIKWKYFPRYWPLCGPGEFPTQRPVTRCFDVFFDLSLNKRLSKQSCGWWFETLPRPLWRHSNEKVPDLQGPRLLTWINCNPNMDKYSHPL